MQLIAILGAVFALFFIAAKHALDKGRNFLGNVLLFVSFLAFLLAVLAAVPGGPF